MRIFLSLALNTARDVIRQPIVAVLTVACILTIGMLPVVAVFSLGQEERIVRDGTMASCFVYGLFVVIASSLASISRQVRNGTAGSVLCKPVSRETFLTATYCGILLVGFLFVAISTLASILSVRMALAGILTDWVIGGILAVAVMVAFVVAAAENYAGHNFCSALFRALALCLLLALAAAAFVGLDATWVRFGSLIQWRLLPAALLLFAAIAMLAAIAVALSTRFPPVMVLFCCCLVFALGLVSDYLFLQVAGGAPWASICSAFLPNWQYLWLTEPAAGVAAPGYVLGAFLYAVSYIAGILCLSIWSFRGVEI